MDAEKPKWVGPNCQSGRFTTDVEPWEAFRDRHGDMGRDVALWLGRRHCGLTQAELGQKAGGMAYPAGGHAVRSIDRKRHSDRALARWLDQLESQLVDIAT